MNTAAEKDQALLHRIVEQMRRRNPNVDGWWLIDAKALRLAQLTLHRWCEEECNGTIQREEHKLPDGTYAEGRPFRVYLPEGHAPRTGGIIPDREAGALRRVAKVCKDSGLHYYYQTDCRGCALFVAAQPLTHENYLTHGIPCI